MSTATETDETRQDSRNNLASTSTDMISLLENDFNDILVSTSPYLLDDFEPFKEDQSLPEVRIIPTTNTCLTHLIPLCYAILIID